MKKQTIKLNESQLRQMVREALNELDWKTYANAAKKQADADGEYKLSHDKSNRAYKFNLAASNEFNKKYRHKGNYTDDFTRLHANEPTNWGTTELPKLHLNASDLCDDEHGFLGRDFDEKDKPYWVNKNQHGELKQVKKIPPKTFERHPELMQKFKDAEQEMENYYNGDYDYTPDKGWHLKESQLRNIIKESIKKVLNEEYGVDIQDTLAWVQKKHPDMSPEEQERFAKNIIKKREHDNYVFDMHMTTSGGNDSFKRELTWDEAKRCYMKYGRYIDEISYKDKRYGPYAEWNEFNPKAFFDEDE